nr:HAD family phosphatase [Oscillospiraceae bacterium]
MNRIVFSDIDGTLINSRKQITPATLSAIRTLEEKGIPFVISSGRGPTGIYPILEEYGIRCPMVAYSGSVILDENRKVLFHRGIPKERVKEILAFIEQEQLDMTWSLHSLEQWVVKDRTDSRVLEQEALVQARSEEGTADSIADPQINKILCICAPGKLPEIQKRLSEAFPEYTVVASSGTLLDVMDASVTKGTAIHTLCKLWQVPVSGTIAFGDHYNDVDMLRTAGKGYLMANAPEALKQQFPLHTLDNDHDGIPHALKALGILE